MLRLLPLERIRTDPHTWCSVVFKDKMQFARLPFVVAVLFMFALGTRVFFHSRFTDCEASHK